MSTWMLIIISVISSEISVSPTVMTHQVTLEQCQQVKAAAEALIQKPYGWQRTDVMCLPKVEISTVEALANVGNDSSREDS